MAVAVCFGSFARAEDGAAHDVSGSYSIAGTMSDGTAYEGHALLTLREGVYEGRFRSSHLPEEYRASGKLDDVELVLNWDEDSAAVFALYDDDTLRAQFVNVAGLPAGSMVLTPTAENPFAEPDLAGGYTITGSNPDGSAFTGEADVVAAGEGYAFTWTYPNGSTLRGTGRLVGSTLTVTGEGVPETVYTLSKDGRLSGTFSGTGTEILVPKAAGTR